MSKPVNVKKDYFGEPVVLGDIVLGAKARKTHYHDTDYCIAVVIGETKGMIRLHQLGSTKACIGMDKKDILESLSTRCGRKGGAIAPAMVINLGRNSGITKEEIDVHLKSKVQPVPIKMAVGPWLFP